MSSRKKIKDLQLDKFETELPQCPHCKKNIINYLTIFYNRMYQCTDCKGRYFIMKLPLYVFANF